MWKQNLGSLSIDQLQGVEDEAAGFEDWLGHLFLCDREQLKGRKLSATTIPAPRIQIAGIVVKSLLLLRDLMKTGKVSPIIDRHYTLHKLPDGIRHLEEGHAFGKVVITFQ